MLGIHVANTMSFANLKYKGSGHKKIEKNNTKKKNSNVSVTHKNKIPKFYPTKS